VIRVTLMGDSATALLRSLGGERSHAQYMPGASETMMAAVRLEHAASEQDFVDVHTLATQELGPGLASLEEIKRVDGLTGASIWVIRRRGEVTGFLAPLALTAEGVAALVDNTFDAARIDQKWVARMGEPLAGFYCWCYAGKDQVSRGALVLGLRTLIDRYFPDLPFFGRDSTEAGARIMRHLGFYPFDNTPHLFWRCASVMEMAA
jgi:hypothetical protein